MSPRSNKTPPFEFEFHFDRDFLLRAHWRDYYWRPLVVIALVLAWLAYRHSGGELGDSAIQIAVIGIIVLIAISCLGFWMLIDRTLKAWNRLSPGGTLRYTLTEDAIECHTETTETRVAWGDLFRIWIYRDVWIIEIIKMQSFVFPPSAAPEAARDFVVQRCRDAGIRVIRGRRFLP